MKGRRIVASGRAAAVITQDKAREVLGLETLVTPDPVAGTPTVVPVSRNVGTSVGVGVPLGASASPGVGATPTGR